MMRSVDTEVLVRATVGTPILATWFTTEPSTDPVVFQGYPRISRYEVPVVHPVPYSTFSTDSRAWADIAEKPPLRGRSP